MANKPSDTAILNLTSSWPVLQKQRDIKPA